MLKNYKVNETITLAQCEIDYFQDLIFYLEKSGYYHLFFDLFIELKQFRNNYFDQLIQSKHEHIFDNLVHLRLNFYDLHYKLLRKIDKITENKISKKTKRHITGSIYLAENCISNLMTNHNDKENLSNLSDYLKITGMDLRKQLKKLNNIIHNMSIKYIERKLSKNEYDQFMTQVDHFYRVQLSYLHEMISSKLNLTFKHNEMTNTCNELLKLRHEANQTRYCSSHLSPDIKNINVIINFITSNLCFFLAPFKYRQFQYWSQNHFEEMREISDGLRKYLHNHSLINEFKEALELLDEEHDDGLLKYFLNTFEDVQFIQFLEECIKNCYYIIDEWNYYAAMNNLL